MLLLKNASQIGGNVSRSKILVKTPRRRNVILQIGLKFRGLLCRYEIIITNVPDRFRDPIRIFEVHLGVNENGSPFGICMSSGHLDEKSGDAVPIGERGPSRSEDGCGESEKAK